MFNCAHEVDTSSVPMGLGLGARARVDTNGVLLLLPSNFCTFLNW